MPTPSLADELCIRQGAHVSQYGRGPNEGTALGLACLDATAHGLLCDSQDWERQLQCVTHLQAAEKRQANKVLKEGLLGAVGMARWVLHIWSLVCVPSTGDLEKRGKKSKLWMRRRVYITGAEVLRARRIPCMRTRFHNDNLDAVPVLTWVFWRQKSVRYSHELHHTSVALSVTMIIACV